MKNRMRVFTTILLALGFLGLLPRVHAVNPAPDGGYPGGNTAEGENALLSLTTGTNNTAVGWFSLKTVTTGQYNTAIGSGALSFNTASLNTATGGAALWSNITGTNNTANGFAALFSNTTGLNNTAIGSHALFSNDTNGSNTAMGYRALYSNTTGVGNTAVGSVALHNNLGGDSNTAFGHQAGLNITGSGNVCIGQGVIGVAGESNTTRIRNVYTSTASGRAVYVNSDGKIGTLASSRRFKEEIRGMDKASEVLFALKPVSFRYKKEFDAGRVPMFGLIAEDVEQVNPDLVSRNEKGEVESVRYEMVNTMLLNEFLKEHRKVEQQQGQITELNSRVAKQEVLIAQQRKDFAAAIAQQQKQIETLASSLQKVSTQLEMRKPAPRIVVNNH